MLALLALKKSVHHQRLNAISAITDFTITFNVEHGKHEATCIDYVCRLTFIRSCLSPRSSCPSFRLAISPVPCVILKRRETQCESAGCGAIQQGTAATE